MTVSSRALQQALVGVQRVSESLRHNQLEIGLALSREDAYLKAQEELSKQRVEALRLLIARMETQRQALEQFIEALSTAIAEEGEAPIAASAYH